MFINSSQRPYRLVSPPLALGVQVLDILLCTSLRHGLLENLPFLEINLPVSHLVPTHPLGQVHVYKAKARSPRSMVTHVPALKHGLLAQGSTENGKR